MNRRWQCLNLSKIKPPYLGKHQNIKIKLYDIRYCYISLKYVETAFLFSKILQLFASNANA